MFQDINWAQEAYWTSSQNIVYQNILYSNTVKNIINFILDSAKHVFILSDTIYVVPPQPSKHGESGQLLTIYDF